MTALTRWNPFKQLARSEPYNDFDDVFRALGLRSPLRDAETPLDLRLDVTDDDKAFRVEVDMPGIGKDDIDVRVEGNQVSISAEVKRESKKTEGKQLHAERYCGTTFRSFTLPQEVDAAQTEAKYADGVLSLMLPKKPNGQSRKIQVG